jgi:hypothetical protein
VRSAVRGRLSAFKPLLAPCQKELAERLYDPDESVKNEAADLIASLGPVAPDAVAALVRRRPALGKDPSWFEFREPRPRLGPAVTAAVPGLIEELDCESNFQRDEACRLLAGSAPAPRMPCRR